MTEIDININEQQTGNDIIQPEHTDIDIYTKIRYLEPELINHPTLDLLNPTEYDLPIIDELLKDPSIDGYNTVQLKEFFHSIYIQEINNKVNDILINSQSNNVIEILDVGCGTGVLFDYIFNYYSNEKYSSIKFKYTGVDFNPNKIVLANNRLNNKGELPSNIECIYIESTLEGFIKDTNKLYDVIVFNNVFDYDYFKIANRQFISDYFNIIYNYKDMNEFIISNITLYYTNLLANNGLIAVNFINDNEFSREHGEQSLYILNNSVLDDITRKLSNIYSIKRNYLNILTDIIFIYK